MASKSRMGGGSGLTNPRKEALLLYREILKTAKAFTWKHPSVSLLFLVFVDAECRIQQGVSWGQVLKESARKEFEQARWEKDPETIARMLLNGRHSLMIIQEKVSGYIAVSSGEIANSGLPVLGKAAFSGDTMDERTQQEVRLLVRKKSFDNIPTGVL